MPKDVIHQHGALTIEANNTTSSNMDRLKNDWTGPDDPENPINWSRRRKWTTTMIVSLFTFITPTSSSMVAPALTSISQDLVIASDTTSSLVLSIFVLGYAFGPLCAGPLSELYGRVRVLQLANLLYLVFNTGCGFCTTKTQMLVFRFLSGIGGSAPLAIGGGVLSDCWSADERGKSIAIYTMAPLFGPAFGPIVGSLIVQHTTWRWIFWSASIADAIIQIVGLLILQESYAPEILRARERRVYKKGLKTDSEASAPDVSEAIRKHMLRPFVFLGSEPIIQVLAIYMAFLYGMVYLVLSTFPKMWDQVYNQSVQRSGLNYISIALGDLLGTQICAPLTDKIYKRLKTKNNGEGLPEFRLPLMVPGACLVPIGLFLYGWSVEAQLHWTLPNIGVGIFAAGTIMSFQCAQNYMIDAYSRYAASAVGAVTVLRSLAGFGFPLFGPHMYAALLYGWSNSILGLIAILVGIPAPFAFWRYGSRLRAHSQVAGL